LVSLIVAATGLSGCAQTTGGDQGVDVPSAPSRILPWEWWRDLSSVASVPDGDRVVMRSSHCPSGCEFDRHSEGDSRFIQVREDGEGVIFSTEGAGAVTRIWMVMGEGVSEPLDGAVRLRVRVDGHQRPVVDLPLSDVFSGTTAPFLSPMVADRTTSGGGNVSYVPIPFRDGCEITLVGAEASKIWFQVNARLVDDPGGIESFTGKEPVEEFRAMLLRAGSDPWRGPSLPIISGSAVLAPGEGKVIAHLEGPDLVNGLIVRVKRKHWPRLGLRFTFDDREPQLIPVVDLFGVPNINDGVTRSLFVGVDSETDLYCYFPMPFFEGAKVELLRRPVEGPSRLRVEYALRLAGEPPPENAGIFSVQVQNHDKTLPGTPLEFLNLEGRGSVVGLLAGVRPSDGRGWIFLEGDERIFIDGEAAPSWHGTGVEDLFNGGFYFRDQSGKPTPFTTALAGAPFIHPSVSWAVMYRLFLGDAIVFHDGIRAELETGPTGELSMRGRTVVFYYSAREDDDKATTAPDG
jgi:hypothetical protein